jgi:CobQ-like glutamine amidotransferase family enzyme
VGFENHSGRTFLDDTGAAFATVLAGAGNNGRDGTEGSLTLAPGAALRGLRIGTYLHGPLLPRNPHVADMLIQAGLARTGQSTHLAPLDDRDEWRAHDEFVARTLHTARLDRLPLGLGRAVAVVSAMIGR